jgi:hypothetical protein
LYISGNSWSKFFAWLLQGGSFDPSDALRSGCLGYRLLLGRVICDFPYLDLRFRHRFWW